MKLEELMIPNARQYLENQIEELKNEIEEMKSDHLFDDRDPHYFNTCRDLRLLERYVSIIKCNDRDVDFKVYPDDMLSR